MVRRNFLTAVLAAVAALMLAVPAAWGEKVALTAAEIEELLTGNTITGTWAGSEYKQYFSADGITVYVPKNGDSDEGKWRVDAEANTYESWWPTADWMGYKVVRDGDTYFWVDGAGDEHPFTVSQGRQI